MVDELYAKGVPREEAFDLNEKVHCLAEALLKPKPVVLRRGRRRGRV